MDDFDPTAADYGDGQMSADELDQARVDAGIPDRHDRTGHAPIEQLEAQPVGRQAHEVTQTARPASDSVSDLDHPIVVWTARIVGAVALILFVLFMLVILG